MRSLMSALLGVAGMGAIQINRETGEVSPYTGGVNVSSALLDELYSLRAPYCSRSPKKPNKVSQAKRRKYKRQGRK